jgi:hypothetical protein
VTLFAEKVGTTVNDTPLSRSLKLAMLQDPTPSKIYGVRVGTDYAAALASLEGVDDVTFVSLAEEYDIGAGAHRRPTSRRSRRTWRRCRPRG